MSSPIHRILRERQEYTAFNQSLDNLLKENAPRLRLMERVCARLEFCEIMKYGSHFPRHSQVPERLRLDYQIDRLITHLALTALDIIAREEFSGPDFLEFPKWFSSALGKTPPPSAIVPFIERLSDSAGPSTIDVLRTSMPALQDAYYAEEGVSRLFKRILRERVEPWLKEWLCSVFFIAKDVPFRDTIAPASLPWPGLGPTERFALLSDYLYSVRNQYTHTSAHADTQEHGPFRGPHRDSPSFSMRYSDIPDLITDKVRWFVALRSDLAESEVVRMLAVHLMRKWLGYVDDAFFIQSYLSRVTFRYHAYALDHELVHNSGTVGSWALIESRVILLGRFDLGELLLATTAAEALAAADRPRGYRPFAQDQLQKYLHLVTSLNNTIRHALQEGEALSDMHHVDALLRSALQRAASSQQTVDLARAISALRQSLDQTLSVPFY